MERADRRVIDAFRAMPERSRFVFCRIYDEVRARPRYIVRELLGFDRDAKP